MSGRKIFLIDSDPVLASDITEVLTKVGYSVSKGEHGSEVLSLAREVKPDLSVFEIAENECNCIDVAKELYEKYDIPFIVLSECEDQDTINKAIMSGALSYLLKPIRIKQLIPIIESSLRRAEDIRHLRYAEQNLSTAVQTARVISAAIGIMMERFRLTNKMAFDILRTEARSNHKKIIEIANEILMAADTVNQFNITNNKVKE